MRPLSRSKALSKLRKLKDEFRDEVSVSYEHRAKSCDVCDTKGACCLDAHFVNVRISSLEAEAIGNVIRGLSPVRRAGFYARLEETIDRSSRGGTDVISFTYACPLFDAQAGCLVHDEAKPLACIAHACYENEADLPPDDLLAERESAVEKLNLQTFGRPRAWLPIPLAIRDHV